MNAAPMAPNFGPGMVTMDLCVIALLWITCAVQFYVSYRLGDAGVDGWKASQSRWVMTVGFTILAAMLSYRFLQLGDLPMSPPYAVGHMLVCLGYCGLAHDRLKGLKR